MGRKAIWVWAIISALWIGYVTGRLTTYCVYDGLESYCTAGYSDIALPIEAILMLVGLRGVMLALVFLFLLLVARWIYRKIWGARTNPRPLGGRGC